jgi:hypothetical protein
LVRTVQNLPGLQERCTVRLTIQPEIWPKGAQTLLDEKHVAKGQKANVDEKYECLWLQWPTTLQCEEQRVENTTQMFPCHISCISPHQIHQSCLQWDYTLRERHIQRAMKTASVKQGHLNNIQIPSCPDLCRSHYMLSMGVCCAESSSWWMKIFPRTNATHSFGDQTGWYICHSHLNTPVMTWALCCHDCFGHSPLVVHLPMTSTC